MAPGAKIVYVGAPNNYQDLDAALNHVVDRHLAQIVTNSYGFARELLPPGFIKPFEQTRSSRPPPRASASTSRPATTATRRSTIRLRHADWPASSPWVTAVGGTSLGVSAGEHASARDRLGHEQLHLQHDDPRVHPDRLAVRRGWRRQPGLRQAVLSAALSRPPAAAVPDVAALGDPQTGLLVGQTQTFPDGT